MPLAKHPPEYDATPEGRICAEARDIAMWLYERHMKRQPAAEWTAAMPDYRDFLDELGPLIRVELLRAKIEATEFATLQIEVMRYQLKDAERDVARIRGRRAGPESSK